MAKEDDGVIIQRRKMHIKTNRLIITNFTLDMAQAVHQNSLDEDTRRFLPDEVFETVDAAKETISYLMSQYENSESDGPLVYPVLLPNGTNIGYVQAVPTENAAWEIGYHIAKQYTGKGYATEAVTAFLPEIMKQLNLKTIYGICDAENIASCKVLEKCGFKMEFEGQGVYQGKIRQIKKYVFEEV